MVRRIIHFCLPNITALVTQTLFLSLAAWLGAVLASPRFDWIP
jgi:hypothetical protein